MTITLNPLSTIAEIDAYVSEVKMAKARKARVSEAAAVLTERKTRDNRSGKNARSWLAINAPAELEGVVVVPTAKKQSRAARVKIAGGNPRTNVCNGVVGILPDLDTEGKTVWWGLYKALKDVDEAKMQTAARLYADTLASF